VHSCRQRIAHQLKDATDLATGFDMVLPIRPSPVAVPCNV
jgi:hypothetical protein